MNLLASHILRPTALRTLSRGISASVKSYSRTSVVCSASFRISATGMKPTLHYFPLRGRGEPIRLALAALDIQDFVEAVVDREAMKNDREIYQFGQCPRYQDDDIDMCQSNAILRHIARKHNMYGANEKEMCYVDMLLDGVESIKLKYLNLIYVDELKDEPKEAFWTAHCDASTTAARNAGAHFKYLADLIARTGAAFSVGSTVTVADIALFDVIDMMLRIFGDRFTAAYPTLAALHSKVAAVPGVKTYLESDRRPAQQNGVALG